MRDQMSIDVRNCRLLVCPTGIRSPMLVNEKANNDIFGSQGNFLG